MTKVASFFSNIKQHTPEIIKVLDITHGFRSPHLHLLHKEIIIFTFLMVIKDITNGNVKLT